MKRFLPVDELARDGRFAWIHEAERQNDPRSGPQSNGNYQRAPRFSPEDEDSLDRARVLMHGIFMGEVQALEGAGRTCWDFDTGSGEDEAPYALKLDMARQCWDESRHVEISIKLAEWMGTGIGEFGEGRGLYQAACNPDPALRLTAVNRGIEGLAIDVFATMRKFGQAAGDPVLTFCEDWMLADEVTHVKMGSDWLRRLTADDPERRERALEFQRLVDKIFSGAGRAEESKEDARQFRKLAGFSDEDIDAAHVPLGVEEEREARMRLVAGSRTGPVPAETA
ncbi:MAG TPA: DUF455 family protein [Acidimicrobiales bacterium]|nr:DUF455 family protein [Acidimicrobiales bacterium]